MSTALLAQHHWLSPIVQFLNAPVARRTLLIAVAAALAMPAVQSLQPHGVDTVPADSQLGTKASNNERAMQALNTAPVYFEVNRGQWDANIKYAARGLRHSVALRADKVVITSNRAETATELYFRNGNPAPQQEALNVTRTKANYLTGNDGSRWISGVDTYAKIAYRNIYPGIDAVFYGNQQELEYDFVVAPHADPSLIALEYRGADSVTITAAGELAVVVGGETLTQKAPVIYQDINGERRYVQGRYIARADGAIGFELAAYDTHAALYIDPVVSLVSIFHSGTDAQGDEIRAIRVDANGNFYVAGDMCGANSTSTLPVSANAVDKTLDGSCDAWVAKLDTTGTPLYISYLGGAQHDQALDLAIDGDGAMYLTGRTASTDFPQITPAQAPTGIINGSYLSTSYDNIADAFVTKISPDGGHIVYSTFLGGNVYDLAYAITVDSQGRAYVGGSTTSTNLPITADAARKDITDSMSTGTRGPYSRGEGFLLILSAQGNAIEYGTYFGGNDSDVIQDIEINAQGDIYLTGSTMSTNLPVSPYAGQTTRGGNNDSFVAKIARSTGSTGFLTYLGGPVSDYGYALAIDNDGGAYAVGQSDGQFPKTGTTPTRAYLAKIGPRGEHYYTVNAGGLAAQDVAIAPNGDVVTAGLAYSGIYSPITLVNPIQDKLLGDIDGILTVFDPDTRSVVLSSYLGCGLAGGYYASDFFAGVGVDRAGNIYAGGITQTPSYSSCHTAANGGVWPEKIVGPAFSYNTARMPLVIKVGSMLPQTDLSVDVVASAATVRTGVPYSYGTTVRNNGAQAAERVVLAQTLPVHAQLDSSTATHGSCLLDAAHTLRCDIGTLAAGEAATITLNVVATSVADVVTTATVVGGVVDNNVSNDSKTVTTAVQSANQAPVANAGGDKVVECAGDTTLVTLDGSQSSDADGDALTYNWSGPFGMRAGVTVQVPYAFGPKQSTSLAVSDDKNASATDTIQVSIVDTTPPDLTAEADITLEATSANGAVHTASYTVSDTCGVTNVAVNGEQPTYPLGSTLVTVTATDRGGNKSTDSTNVIVQDTTPPTLTVPANVSAEASAIRSNVNIGQATAIDIVDGAPSVVNDAPANGFALGTTIVKWTVTDRYHNATTKSQSITVVDTTAPTITIANPTVTAIATGAYTTVTLGDATGNDIFTPVTVTNDAPTGGFVPGTSTVTYTARDANGNSATAKQTVNVQYAFGGYQPPLRQSGVYKLGRVIPVKVVLTYANATPVTTAQPTLAIYQLANGEVAGDPLDINSSSSADTGSTLRYSDGQYVYNLDTSRMPAGTYRFFVDIKDGSAPRVIDIALK